MKREMFYGRYCEGGGMSLPKATLKRAADGSHQVHVNGGPVGELDEKELRDYYLCNFQGSSGVTARQRFEGLVMRCARENSITFDAAKLKVAQTAEGQILWEEVRLQELAEAARR